MHAAVIGVVHDDDVALMKIALEFRQHRRHGFGDGAEMLRDGLGLRHHLPVAGAERGGKIHHVLDDLGARDPHHGIGHVVGNRIQSALDDRKGDRIDFHASNSSTMQPIASLCTVASGGTTMVASNSSMISGPWRAAPPIAPRSTIWTANGCLAPGKGNLPGAALRRAGPGRDLHMAEVEPAFAQATSGDAHFHQFDRGFIAIAVGLEVFGDEAFAYFAQNPRPRTAR